MQIKRQGKESSQPCSDDTIEQYSIRRMMKSRQELERLTSLAAYGGNYKPSQLNSKVNEWTSIDKSLYPYYLLLKAILETRLGELESANRYARKLLKISNSESNYYLILGLISFGLKDKPRGFEYLEKCLQYSPVSKQALYFLSSACVMSIESIRECNKYIKLVSQRFPNNIKIAIDSFVCSLLVGQDLNQSARKLLFDLNEKELSSDIDTGSLRLLWRQKDFSNIKKSYRAACLASIRSVELALSTRSHCKKYSADDFAHYSLAELPTVIDESFCRSYIEFPEHPDCSISTKVLQMLYKPDYWIKSQDSLFSILCVEILQTKAHKSKLVMHEIGPGCGYLIKLLSAIQNVTVSGSDCYGSFSYDPMKMIANNTSLANFQANGKYKLETFGYFMSNFQNDQLEKIYDFPVLINNFSDQLLESSIVFSHLPCIDQSFGNKVWDANQWLKFFNNIFAHQSSKVRSIVIAANAHSSGLNDLANTPLKKNSPSFDLIIYRGRICNGLVVIARKKACGSKS